MFTRSRLGFSSIRNKSYGPWWSMIFVRILFPFNAWAASWQNKHFNDLCGQQRLRSSWASAQSDQSSLSALRNSLIRVFTVCIKKYSILLNADSQDPDPTGRMPRLIWVFAGCTEHLVGFVIRRLIYRTNWYNLTKFWICIDIDKIYVGIAIKHQFSFIYNRVMALEWCQNFVSAQYLENELMEFDEASFACASILTAFRLGLLHVNFHKLTTELWPLIAVRILFPLISAQNFENK